jgi:hypothetical protein
MGFFDKNSWRKFGLRMRLEADLEITRRLNPFLREEVVYDLIERFLYAAYEGEALTRETEERWNTDARYLTEVAIIKKYAPVTQLAPVFNQDKMVAVYEEIPGDDEDDGVRA